MQEHYRIAAIGSLALAALAPCAQAQTAPVETAEVQTTQVQTTQVQTAQIEDREPTVTERVDASYMRDSEHAVSLDWGTAGVSLAAGRHREGRRQECDEFTCSNWYRDYSARVQAWVAVDGRVDLVARYAATRETRGNPLSPVLTDRTRGVSQRASLALESDTGVLTLSAFDTTGWSATDVASFAESANNGAGRARRGTGVSYSLPVNFGPLSPRAGIAVEQSSTPGMGNETLAMVTLRAQF